MDKEKDIVKYIRVGLRQRGIMVRKVRYEGVNNAPDLWAFIKGQCIMVEIKTSGVMPRHGQVLEMQMLRDNGFDVRVIDSIASADTFVKEMLQLAGLSNEA